jgi:hypothetical protein
MKLSDIEGIGPGIKAKFEKTGIKTVEGLLEKGASEKGMRRLPKLPVLIPQRFSRRSTPLICTG